MKRINLFVLIVAFTLIVGEAGAIGISPSRTILHFKPNLEEKLTLIVYNNGASETRVKLYTRGELEQIASLNKDFLILPPNSQETFHAHLKLPSEEYTPGDHALLIGAVEQAEPKIGKQTMVAAVTGVESQVYIRVPYPGKYISASINIDDVIVGKPILFTVLASSLGSEKIENVTAFIDIYDPQGKKITWLITTKESLSPKESKELYAEWLPINVSAGIYRATTDVHYDTGFVTAETNFRLGDIIIEILDIVTEKISDNLIRFEIEVQSFWNDAIANVYATINVSDKNGNFVGKTTTSPIVISRWSKTKLETFLKTGKLSNGIYDAIVILHYNGKISKKQMQFRMDKRKINPAYVAVVLLILIIIYLLLSKKRGWKNEKNK